MATNVLSSSSAAALIELAAIGQADTLLTCDPQTTFFQQTYARTTNFAIGEHTIGFATTPPSGQNWQAATVVADSLKIGDLLGPIYLDCCLTGLPGQSTNAPNVYVQIWTPAVGYALIKDSTVTIGGTEYETLTGEYMMMHDEISRREGSRASKLIGDYGPYLRTGFYNTDSIGAALTDSKTLVKAMEYSTRTQKILAPLPHFWTRHVGNYLNVAGGAYQDVSLRLNLRSFEDLRLQLVCNFSTGALARDLVGLQQRVLQPDQGRLVGATILATFVQLDVAERRLKAQATQTMRFVYAQSAEYNTINSDAGQVKRVTNMFKNPVTRFVWAWRSATAVAEKEYFRFGGYRAVPPNVLGGTFMSQEVVPECSQIEIRTNQQTRVIQAPEYFLYAQPYAHSARLPTRLVHSYSLALHPDDDSRHSGSLNLSRIDNLELNFTLKERIDAVVAYPSDADYLTQSNKIGGRWETGLEPSDLQPADLTGKILFHAETINFYKQSAGMFALMFPK